MTTELEKTTIKPNLSMGMTARGLKMETFSDAITFATKAAQTDLVPKAYQGKPADIIVAMQMGAEVGLSPMAALRGIAVINGRASMYGDALLAVAQGSGVFDFARFEETWTGTGDSRAAVVTVAHTGGKAVTRTFSVADAKRANLWGKSGPWSTNPDRMLQMRARGFALRDCFGYVLQGFIPFEEARDIPAEIEPFDPAKVEFIEGPPKSKTARLAERVAAVAVPAVGPHVIDGYELGVAGNETPEPDPLPESSPDHIPGPLVPQAVMDGPATPATVDEACTALLLLPKAAADALKQRHGIEGKVATALEARSEGEVRDIIGEIRLAKASAESKQRTAKV